MTYDYIVVGGGSAGATLASRLTEDSQVKVCLLEAGGNGKDLLIRAPAGVVAMLPGKPFKINNWCYNTTPQPGLNGRVGYQPRGNALGGSSAINAMLYVRGHQADYDRWAYEEGAAGWSWDEVLPYFKKAENNEWGSSDCHGDQGPLHVSQQQTPRPISRDFVKAAVQLGHKEVTDFNTGDNEGVGYYQVTQFHGGSKNGERCSSAAAYLHPHLERPNLTVITGARATRILTQGKKAVGVEYQGKDGRQSVQASKEVILSGGAFNSPHLLMLSGIGDAQELAAHGIDSVHHLPGVGKNLQDHIDFVLAYKTKDTDNFGIGAAGTVNLIKNVAKWKKDGTGMVASPFAEGAAFLKTDAQQDIADAQLHFVISIVDDHARNLHLGYGYSCHVCVLRPHSVGEVFLQSADPLAAPGIDPRFFSDDRDMKTMVEGVKKTRAIMQTKPLASYQHKELFMRGDESDEEIADHIRQRADTVYHPVGTCKMGVDDMAVVDPQLRVHGMENLRVVDASVMPSLIGGNTNAPSIMIGEKAADLIRAAR